MPVLAKGAVVYGPHISFGTGCGVWFNAVIRDDGSGISIGDCTNIQDGVVLHNSPGFPLKLGNYVTVGHRAVVHGCTVGDGSMIGMGAIVMDGAVIGPGCLVAAGAIVTQGMEVPAGSLVMGAPAKLYRMLTESEIQQMRQVAELYCKRAEKLAQQPELCSTQNL